jgi:flagellar biosynthesis protein FlhF
MRLKAFTAATIAEAMQQVRDALGDDAAIVSTEEESGGVRVVAALDPAAPPPPRSPGASAEWLLDRPSEPSVRKPNGTPALLELLAHHGATEPVVARLASGPTGPTLQATLAARLHSAFRFAALSEWRDPRTLLLAGPPGAGKTLAVAKLAARAVLTGQAVRLITTDVSSAGALEQLNAFAKPLNLTAETAEGAAALAAAVAKRRAGPPALTLIDTQGVNPYDGVELAGLAAQIAAARAEPVLVLGAGGDARESGEIAELFARIGCMRLLVTRLDLARRLGGVLSAAVSGLILAETGASPLVAHGLQPLTPAVLARSLVIDIGRSAGPRVPEPAP